MSDLVGNPEDRFSQNKAHLNFRQEGKHRSRKFSQGYSQLGTRRGPDKILQLQNPYPEKSRWVRTPSWICKWKANFQINNILGVQKIYEFFIQKLHTSLTKIAKVPFQSVSQINFPIIKSHQSQPNSALKHSKTMGIVHTR